MNDFWNTAGALAQGFWRKTTAWRRSSLLTYPRTPLVIPQGSLQHIHDIFKKEQTAQLSNGGQPEGVAEDEERVCRIRKETEVWNLNNVTRTQAYWNIYRDFPELHWAMLAHLVSRNGGWSMTDLKGEWLPKLLKPEDAESHFEMLESCNAVIFRDAYPQLKLYAESRHANAPLFALLPAFGVSDFMRPIWHRFWETRESVLLTVALIVNEQHVIQGPVVENRRFHNRVFSEPHFRSLPLLQTNQILFPLSLPWRKERHLLPLAGRVMENFQSLEERINFGKCLYAMLFGYSRVLSGVEAFASEVPHTGSRADYWPNRYCPSVKKTGGKSLEGNISAGEYWYSPKLENAWPDRPLPDFRPQDWFTDRSALQALSYLSSPKPPRIIDMTYEHLLCVRKWQAAAMLARE